MVDLTMLSGWFSQRRFFNMKWNLRWILGLVQ